MIVTAKRPIRVGEITYSIGEVVKGLDEQDIKRLVSLGDAECDETFSEEQFSNEIEPLKAELEAKDTEIEALKAGTKTLDIEALRAEANELGVQYSPTLGAEKLAARIVEFKEANK